MNEVNRHDFKNQVSNHSGDRKTSRLTCFGILVIMIYSHFKPIHSLRGLVLSLGLRTCSFYHLGLKSVKRSTISDALKERSSDIYMNFYYQLLSNLNREQRRKIGKKIHLIDATTISLCLEKYRWAKYKKTKAGIKLHTMIDGETIIPEQVIITDAKKHDLKGINNRIKFNKGDIYVYDRAYCSYKYLYSIEKAKAFFVTRLKSNWLIRVIKSNEVNKDNNILEDVIVEVAGTKAKDYPKELRVVTFYHEKNKKTLRFLTNNFEIDAEVIAEIYKQRWQIELFFKWIKQHLKIKSFLSTSKNGVQIQVWCALITYILLAIIQSRLIIGIELFDIYRRLSECLDRRQDIFDFLSGKIIGSIGMPQVQNPDQLELNYA